MKERLLEVMFILALVWLLTLNGCNTVNGFGEDLKAVTSPYITE